ECEAEVQKPRRPTISGRRVAAARPLEHLQADATEFDGAVPETVAGVRRKRQGHPSEPAVEGAQRLEVARHQRDVVDLGGPLTEFTAHRCFLEGFRCSAYDRRTTRPWYVESPFRQGSRPATPRDLRNSP